MTKPAMISRKCNSVGRYIENATTPDDKFAVLMLGLSYMQCEVLHFQNFNVFFTSCSRPFGHSDRPIRPCHGVSKTLSFVRHLGLHGC